jgi:Uma2 family endonuclease
LRCSGDPGRLAIAASRKLAIAGGALVVTEPQRRVTAQDYLALDRSAHQQHEFVEGIIYAMSGGTREHGLVTANAVGELRYRLRSRPCEAYGGNVRVKAGDADEYVYPDVVVACGDIKFEDSAGDTLLNPPVVIEVLSPTTEAYDRGRKAALYRRIPSLQQYVLIAQDRVSVEVFSRQGGQWSLAEATRLEETLHLDSVDCDLPLAEVYAKVRFGAPDGAVSGGEATPPPSGTPA